MNASVLVSRAEAARLCGVSIATFDRHVREHLVAKKIGGRVLFDLVAVRRWAIGDAVARVDVETSAPAPRVAARGPAPSARVAEIHDRLLRRQAEYRQRQGKKG
jgi:hypothetical protein